MTESGRVAGRITLELDFVLDHKCLPLVIYSFVEFGGNGMMSCRVLDDEAFVPFDTFEDGGLLDRPGADVSPFFGGLRVFLLGVRWCPS